MKMFNLRLQQASAQLEKTGAPADAAPGHRATGNPHLPTPLARSGACATKRLDMADIVKFKRNGGRGHRKQRVGEVHLQTRWPRPSWCASSAGSRTRSCGKS